MVAYGYIFSFLYGIFCITIGTVLHKIRFDNSTSRKAIHILIGGEWLILDYFMPLSFHFLLVCIIFTVGLAVEYKLKLIPSMSSSADNAPGTVWYGIAMTTLAICQLVFSDFRYAFGVAVFCTSVGDGFAALIGGNIHRFNPRIFGKKTLFGSMTVFFASVAVAEIFSFLTELDLSHYSCIALGTLAASVELICRKGTDNLVLTLSTAVGAYLLSAFPMASQYAFSVALSPLAVCLIFGHRKLTVGGLLGAIALAAVTSIAFGDFGFFLLIIYFLSALITDKIKYKALKSEQKPFCLAIPNSGRTLFQVLENGAAAFICAVIYIFTGNVIFTAGFVLALAQSLSDTAASGIGSVSGRTYDIFRRTSCASGTSGGMSVIGTVVSLAAPFGFAAVAYILRLIDPYQIIAVAFIAFLGTLFDSFLGSVAQVRYCCPICGSNSEHRTCCNTDGSIVRGLRYVTNGTVNLICNLLSTFIFLVISFFQT